MKKIVVVAAILMHEDEILCAQRAESKLDYISKKYEFPGGKIEEGETKKEALERELEEELSIKPKINDLYLTVVHQYPDFELTMLKANTEKQKSFPFPSTIRIKIFRIRNCKSKILL